MGRKLKFLIVDDEKPARDRLRRLLGKREDAEVLEECRSGVEAVAAIRKHPQADAVFLDIELPDLTGFQVVSEVGARQMPPVIFVTAYNHYAVEAFEVHALDYILKPFDRERLYAALERLQDRHGDPDLADRLEKAMKRLETRVASDGRKYSTRLLLLAAGGRRPVQVADIVWVEAVGNYCRIHTNDRSYLHRISLRELESRLDPALFARIHRSYLVAVDEVVGIRSRPAGDHEVTLSDDNVLRLSRTYRQSFEALLER